MTDQYPIIQKVSMNPDRYPIYQRTDGTWWIKERITEVGPYDCKASASRASRHDYDYDHISSTAREIARLQGY